MRTSNQPGPPMVRRFPFDRSSIRGRTPTDLTQTISRRGAVLFRDTQVERSGAFASLTAPIGGTSSTPGRRTTTEGAGYQEHLGCQVQQPTPCLHFPLPSCREPLRTGDGAADHGDDNKPGSSHPCDKRDNELREPTELQTVIVLVHWTQSE